MFWKTKTGLSLECKFDVERMPRVGIEAMRAAAI